MGHLPCTSTKTHKPRRQTPLRTSAATTAPTVTVAPRLLLHRQHRSAPPVLHGHHSRGKQLLQAQARPGCVREAKQRRRRRQTGGPGGAPGCTEAVTRKGEKKYKGHVKAYRRSGDQGQAAARIVSGGGASGSDRPRSMDQEDCFGGHFYRPRTSQVTKTEARTHRRLPNGMMMQG